MESITIDMCYAVRIGFELVLPQTVKDSFKILRITPPIYKPIRRAPRNVNFKNFRKANNAERSKNWRESAIKELVFKKIDKGEDKEYAEVVGLFNKMGMGNVDHLSIEIINCIEKRDEEFRLNILSLLFDKVVTHPLFAGVMAECALKISKEVPEIIEDLDAHVKVFPKLYNMDETITIDISNTVDPQDPVLIKWTKQKEKRRGFASFMVELHDRQLINENHVITSLKQVVDELNETARRPKTSLTEENTTQYVDFIFETSKKIKGEINEYLKSTISEFIKIPKTEIPSLNMRCKFKLEDALKELNKKE